MNQLPLLIEKKLKPYLNTVVIKFVSCDQTITRRIDQKIAVNLMNLNDDNQYCILSPSEITENHINMIIDFYSSLNEIVPPDFLVDKYDKNNFGFEYFPKINLFPEQTQINWYFVNLVNGSDLTLLTYYCVWMIAQLIKGKSPQEIRTILG